jgi:hypothetical protein
MKYNFKNNLILKDKIKKNKIIKKKKKKYTDVSIVI